MTTTTDRRTALACEASRLRDAVRAVRAAIDVSTDPDRMLALYPLLDVLRHLAGRADRAWREEVRGR